MLYKFLASLTPAQAQQLSEWKRELPLSPAVDGAQFEYVFLTTSIGLIIKVRCCATGKELDLTDYSSW